MSNLIVQSVPFCENHGLFSSDVCLKMDSVVSMLGFSLILRNSGVHMVLAQSNH